MLAPFETILVDDDEGVVTITMNRPEKKNAVTGQMSLELTSALRTAETDGSVRVVVLTGAGGDFCSGADVTDPSAVGESALFYMRRVSDLAMALHRVAKPTIAKVDGVAAGMGANLAFGCDLIVASDRARFSEIFGRRGLSIDCGGSWLLPRLVGLHKAKELAYFADVLPVADIAQMGLVNRVVPVDELDAFVADWGRRLAAGPPIALSMTKALLTEGLGASFEQALENEAVTQALNFTTQDVAEAMAAFAQKREPKFTGR